MKTDILFSYDKIEELIQDFSHYYPRELVRHPVTADYSSRIESLRLMETLKSPFTIAFIGQMRSGKSTLLNSIIGADLAPVGINETTATINWFRYSKESSVRFFRVYWQDGSISDHPLHEISKWIGTQDNIKQTKWIDFYSSSELLQTTSIVDTPGTRSTIQEHENATLGFLLEEQTLMHGGSADAIVYVINPSMRTGDKEILSLFGAKTRLPGASAYNSIAALQKWEHFDGQAWEKAWVRAKKFESELEGKVSCVIPTSGLLANVVANTHGDVWQELLDYVNSKNKNDIEDDLLTQDDFPVSSVKSKINWLVLPLCCRYAKHKDINKVNDLQLELLSLSGVSQLSDLLTNHFISKAKIIKLGTAVSKAAEVGSEVKIRIEQELSKQNELMDNANQALRVIAGEEGFDHVKQYIDDTQHVIVTNTELLESMLKKIVDINYFSKLCFDFYQDDIRCLKLIEHETDAFDTSDKRILQFLFGISGSSIERRLNCDKSINDEGLLNIAKQLNRDFSVKKSMYGKLIYEHAIIVCKRIMENLESTQYEGS